MKKPQGYANHALQLSEKLNYKKGKSRALSGNYGIICIHEGKYNEALNDYFNQVRNQ